MFLYVFCNNIIALQNYKLATPFWAWTPS